MIDSSTCMSFIIYLTIVHKMMSIIIMQLLYIKMFLNFQLARNSRHKSCIFMFRLSVCKVSARLNYLSLIKKKVHFDSEISNPPHKSPGYSLE